MLTVRKARQPDLEQFHAWRNDPVVVASSFTQGEIDLQDHQHWFLNKLADADCGLYVVEFDEVAAGQVRFDIDGSVAKINYSLDAAFRGRGLATGSMTRAIATFCEEYGNVASLVAFVKPENVASCRVFEKLGFDLDGFDNDVQANRYRVDIAELPVDQPSGD